jgi:hypothetical protein
MCQLLALSGHWQTDRWMPAFRGSADIAKRLCALSEDVIAKNVD